MPPSPAFWSTVVATPSLSIDDELSPPNDRSQRAMLSGDGLLSLPRAITIIIHLTRRTAMATLQLGQVKAIKKQDAVGTDKVNVYANGQWVDGPISVSKNDKKPAKSSFYTAFNSSIKIELKEQDGAQGGNNDDSLGSVTISATDIGTHTADFDALNHAFYTLQYTVTA
jgi:hypothetical protein